MGRWREIIERQRRHKLVPWPCARSAINPEGVRAERSAPWRRRVHARNGAAATPKTCGSGRAGESHTPPAQLHAPVGPNGPLCPQQHAHVHDRKLAGPCSEVINYDAGLRMGRLFACV